MTRCPKCGRPLVYSSDMDARRYCMDENEPYCIRVPTHAEINAVRPDGGPQAESQQERMGVK